MQSATARKPEKARSRNTAAAPADRAGVGAAAQEAPAGLPIFLQRKCAACAAGLPCSGGGCVHPGEEELRKVQPSLVVGPADDPMEREADRVAEAAVRAPSPPASPAPEPTPAEGSVRRKPAPGVTGSEELVEEEEEDNQGLQPKLLAGATAPSDPPRVLSTGGPGAPLPAFVRRRVEGVLGADLGHVRVHGDPAARLTAARLRARAFTHGPHIWLGPGESAADLGLMAHEAAHVVQQEGRGGLVQRFGTPEHVQIGDVTGEQLDLGNGVVLSQGEMVALAGDFYGSYEDLVADAGSEEGRRRLRYLIEQKLHRSSAGIGPADRAATPAEEAAAASQVEARYRELALDNFPHFVDRGGALGAWTAHHRRALDQALDAGMRGDAAGRMGALSLEAFGQHFLTDAFSAGHIRTPRQEITEWYTEFGRRVLGGVRAWIERRAIDGLWGQMLAQCPALRPGAVPRGPMGEPGEAAARAGASIVPGIVRSVLESEVRTTIQSHLDAAVPGGPEGLARQFGRYVGGLISLALHNRDNVQGLNVVSDAQPGGWRAYGDDRLAQDPFTFDQVRLAVLAANRDVDQAFAIGMREGDLNRRAEGPGSLPARLFFDFDSAALRSDTVAELQVLVRHMELRPTTYVRVVGHTDPLGSDEYNDGLGGRRAAAVADHLAAAGVEPARVASASAGETRLVERRPSGYARNRRVELSYSSGAPLSVHSPGVDPRLRRAREQVAALGPPFSAERYVPRLDAAAGNEPLPEWRWGRMAPELQSLVRAEIQHLLTAQRVEEMRAGLTAIPDIQRDIPQCGAVTLRPRDVAEGLLDELVRDPLALVEGVLGQAGPR